MHCEGEISKENTCQSNFYLKKIKKETTGRISVAKQIIVVN
jgi:hypothetical protein